MPAFIEGWTGAFDVVLVVLVSEEVGSYKSTIKSFRSRPMWFFVARSHILKTSLA
jgi:hypothetical protein